MWTVVYFEAQGEKATRVRVVSMGFGNDDESKKMRGFFNRGNAFTLQQLQKRFAAKAAQSSSLLTTAAEQIKRLQLTRCHDVYHVR